MKTRKMFLILSLLALLLGACSPAATQPRQNLESGSVEEPALPSIVTEVVSQMGEAVIEEQAVEAVERPQAEMPADAQEPIAGHPAPTRPAEWIAPAPTSVPEEVPPYRPVPTPADNYFQDYGLNPYVDAWEDHLSTFALDVDTASYSVARRYVMDGNLPPTDAIRVEEFVNYFDAGYPAPQDLAFGVYADGAPSPFHDDGAYLLRFGVQGYEVPEWARKPLALTFVIDVSGSMDMENRLELVKRSLTLLVDRLTRDDSVSIVVYGSDARVVLEHTNGAERDTILRAINSLRPEGSTNAEAGLRLGYRMAMQAYRPGAVNRVILCSDGVANVGLTGPDDIMHTIRGYVEEGITLTSIGVGMGNFNDVLMEQLADTGNGNYAYVDTLDEARKVFVEDLTATLQVIALDAKVQVDFNPDVVAYYRLIGYENREVADQDFRNDSVDAGEIGAGHSATALYVVYFRPGVEGRIATLQLRWENPETHQVHEINGNFNTWQLAGSFEQAGPRYRLSVLAAQYAEVLRGSPWAGHTSLERLYEMATPLSYDLDGDEEVWEFVSLLSRASRIRARGN